MVNRGTSLLLWRKFMITAEKILEEARGLPEFELREVLEFVSYLKSRRSQLAAHETAVEANADWAEFEKGAGFWSGKFDRAECYDRKILR
ncbi:hypothetical protein D5125_14785 [Magnetovirga frankeli]|nr:hypothetical protein D5125_14785 [gamma proteobacterium SS-5]